MILDTEGVAHRGMIRGIIVAGDAIFIDEFEKAIPIDFTELRFIHADRSPLFCGPAIVRRYFDAENSAVIRNRGLAYEAPIIDVYGVTVFFDIVDACR